MTHRSLSLVLSLFVSLWNSINRGADRSIGHLTSRLRRGKSHLQSPGLLESIQCNVFRRYRFVSVSSQVLSELKCRVTLRHPRPE